MPACRVLATNHTAFTVSDLDRALAFYSNVLGFSVSAKVRHSGAMAETVTGVPGAELDIAFVDTPGHKIELMQYLKPIDKRRSDLRPCDPGFTHIAFEVDNIDAIVAAVEAEGFRIISPPQTVLAGPRKGGKTVYTRDPDGIVIEFQQAAA